MIFASRIGRALRDADWLTAERAIAWCRILLATTVVLVAGWVATSHHGLDVTGKPLGTDFLSFWTASGIALGGPAQRVYDVAVHAAAQRAAFPDAEPGYFAFFYPPFFLLLCLPLALAPYGVALSTWLAATGFAYWATVRQLLRPTPHATLAILAFPAVALNCGHGQNALLSTALFAAALLLTRSGRAIAAGVAYGLLAYKPHLGLMIPVMLVATGAWATAATAALTVVAGAAAAALVFGPDIYSAFLGASALARTALEGDMVGAAKMQSTFAAVQLWHGSTALAWGAQALTAVGAAAALAATVRVTEDPLLRGAALVSATLLASPFLLDYDLTLLAIPLAVLWRRGVTRDFLPWQKLILLAAFLLPLVSRTLALRFGLPLAPPVVALLFALVVRCATMRPEPAPAPSPAGTMALAPAQ